MDAVRAVVEWMPSEASPLTVQIYLFLGLEGQKAWRALLRVVQFRLTLDTLEEALRSTPLWGRDLHLSGVGVSASIACQLECFSLVWRGSDLPLSRARGCQTLPVLGREEGSISPCNLNISSSASSISASSSYCPVPRIWTSE